MQRAAEMWRFPDRTTTIGSMINAYLTSETDIDDAAIHLLFSANRWEKREEMKRKLESGVNLVVDRYAYSGVAFTMAKGKKELDKEWCMGPDRGLIQPDKVFFLELSPEVAAQRGGYGGERYEEESFQAKVLKEFDSMKQRAEWEVINADGSVEDVHEILKSKVQPVVDACSAADGEQEKGRVCPPLTLLQWD